MSDTTTISSLRQRMIEDMTARQLGPHSQRSHIYSCKRFAAFLKRSPETATLEDIRRFQLYLAERPEAAAECDAPDPCLPFGRQFCRTATAASSRNGVLVCGSLRRGSP